MDKILLRKLIELDKRSKARLRLRTKMMLTILLTVLLTAAACLLTFRYFNRKVVTRGYERIGLDACQILETMLDMNALDSWYETMAAGEKPDAAYYRAQAAARYVQLNSSLDCLYVVYPVENEVYYLLDSEGVSSTMARIKKEEIAKIEEEAFYGRGSLHTEISTLNGVKIFTIWKPIMRENGRAGAWIGADINMKTVIREANTFLVQMLLILLAIVVLLSLIGILVVSDQVVAPVLMLNLAASDLTKAMTDVENKPRGLGRNDEPPKEQDFFSAVPIKSTDEIGDLHRSLIRMEKSSHRFYVDMLMATRERERIGAELSIAEQIQKDMLPRVFPPFPDRREFDIYASMQPAREVGGDFYDFFFVDDDHLAMVMADVSGKGVPAALFMVIAKTLIKDRTLRESTYSPSRILGDVNEQLCEGNDTSQFVTVWLGILELSTGRGIAANAGHEHPVLRRAGEAFELAVYPHSPAVAVMEGIRFKEHEFEMHPGDTLYVYTDGVAEATDARERLFGSKRMLKALNEEPDASPEKLIQAVKKSMDEFVMEEPQFDDITMLCLKYYGPAGTQTDGDAGADG